MATMKLQGPLPKPPRWRWQVTSILFLLSQTQGFVRENNRILLAARQQCAQIRPPSLRETLIVHRAAIQAGDTVVVLGGTGGVGQLVARKLQQANVKVKVASRNPSTAQQVFQDDSIDCVALDLVQGGTTVDDIAQVLQNAHGVVIAVGTTAFPTKKWANGNTPRAIDQDAVQRVAQAAATCSTLKRVVLLSSVGVERTDDFLFKILNLFGVLDAKKAGERAIIQAASMSGASSSTFDYAIVRPGKLVGGPFTNPNVVALLQVQGGATNGVDVAAGDSLLGDCKRDACAETVVQCLLQPACSNVAFSVVSNEGPALDTTQWKMAFEGIKQENA